MPQVTPARGAATLCRRDFAAVAQMLRYAICFSRARGGCRGAELQRLVFVVRAFVPAARDSGDARGNACAQNRPKPKVCCADMAQRDSAYRGVMVRVPYVFAFLRAAAATAARSRAPRPAISAEAHAAAAARRQQQPQRTIRSLPRLRGQPTMPRASTKRAFRTHLSAEMPHARRLPTASVTR